MPIKNKKSSRRSKSKIKNGSSSFQVPTRILTGSFPIVTRSMSQRYKDWLQRHFGSSVAMRVNQLLHPEMYEPENTVTGSATVAGQSDSPTGQSQLIPETSQQFLLMDHPKEAACEPGGQLSHGDDTHLLSLDNTPHPIAPVTQFDSNELESMIIDEGSNAHDDPKLRGWVGEKECINQSPCTLKDAAVQTLETTDQNMGSNQQNPYTHNLKRDVSVQTDRLGDVAQLPTSSTHNALGDSDDAMEVEIQNPGSSGMMNQFVTHDRGEQIFNQKSDQLNHSAVDGEDRSTAQNSEKMSNVLHFDRKCPSIYSHYSLADFSTPTRVITRMDPPETRQHQLDVEAALSHLREVLHNKNLPGLELDKFKKYRG